MRRGRKHLTAEEQQRIVAFDRSRVTVKEFCARLGIGTTTYINALRASEASRRSFKGKKKEILDFAASRVTINEFCESMNITPSGYSDVLRRHGLRGWRRETQKERLLREWRREQRTP